MPERDPYEGVPEFDPDPEHVDAPEGEHLPERLIPPPSEDE